MHMDVIQQVWALGDVGDDGWWIHSPRCDGLPTSRRDPKKQKRYHILDIRTWICSCCNCLNSRVNNLLSDNVLCEGYKALTGPERKDFYKDAGMTVSSLWIFISDFGIACFGYEVGGFWYPLFYSSFHSLFTMPFQIILKKKKSIEHRLLNYCWSKSLDVCSGVCFVVGMRLGFFLSSK